MGTHPIFESDFDCLTELCKQNGRTGESSSRALRQGDACSRVCSQKWGKDKKRDKNASALTNQKTIGAGLVTIAPSLDPGPRKIDTFRFKGGNGACRETSRSRRLRLTETRYASFTRGAAKFDLRIRIQHCLTAQ